MIGLETAIPLYISLLVQVIVLPNQLINVFVRRTDQTRTRFLILTALFVFFNLYSVLAYHFSDLLGTHTEFGIPCLGLIVFAFTYHYLAKETKAFSTNKNSISLLLSLAIVILFDTISSELWTSIFTNLILIPIALYFTTILIKSANKGRNGTSPIYYGALIASIVSCLIPIVNLLVESKTLEIVFFNLIYFSIGLSYFVQHVKQLKLESTIVKSNSLLFSSALVDRSEIEVLKSDRVELTKRETEVLNLLLQNLDHQQVADALNMNYDNARKHASNIYSKYGVSSNAELLVAFSKPKQQTP